MESSPRLLPGQRFCPMEDELLMFYLKPKVNGMPVPGNAALIPVLDLYGDQDPWMIWERFEARRSNDLRRNKDLYFFTQLKKKTARSTRASRTVGKDGTWKGQNAAKEVYLVDQNQQPTSTLLGFKKTYTYRNKGSIHDGRWIMYEYDLDESQIQRKKQVKNDYVLCLLRKNDVLPEKKRRRQEEDEILEDDAGNFDHAESGIEQPPEKRQRRPPHVPTSSLEVEQEQLMVIDQRSSEYGQEGDKPVLAMDENMGMPTPTEDDDAVFVVDLEKSLDCIEVENASSSEALQKMIQSEDDDAAFVANIEESLECIEVENAPCSEAIYFQGENGGEQPLAANHKISNMLPEEDFVSEMEEFLLNGVSSDIEVAAAFDGSSNGCGGLNGFEDGVCMPESLVEVLAYEQQKNTDLPDWLGSIDFSPEANDFPCGEMQPATLEAEASSEVDVRRGNDSSEAMVGEDWLMAFMEGQENEEKQNTMEVGDWDSAAYVDFGYNLAF